MATTIISRKASTAPRSRGLREPAVKPVATASSTPLLDFVNSVLERGKRIPNEELDKIPTDFAANHKHYLYGHSKQQ